MTEKNIIDLQENMPLSFWTELNKFKSNITFEREVVQKFPSDEERKGIMKRVGGETL